MSRPIRRLLALTPGLAPFIPLAILAVAILLLLGGGRAIGIRWDPLGLDRRDIEAARARATRAESDAAARAAEVAGERRQAERLDRALQTVRAAEALTSTALQTARTAEDAEIPLSPERAARLRAHDGELCRLAADLAGCAAAPEPS